MTDTRIANLRRTVTGEFPEDQLLLRLRDCTTFDDVLNLLLFVVANLGYDRLVHGIEEGIVQNKYALTRDEPVSAPDERAYDKIMTSARYLYEERERVEDPYAFHKAFEYAQNELNVARRNEPDEPLIIERSRPFREDIED